MRFVACDERGLDLKTIERALQKTDPGYAVVRVSEDTERGALHLGDVVLGDVALLVPSDPEFPSEVAELSTELEGMGADDVDERTPGALRQALDLLQDATQILVLRVRFKGGTEATLRRIDPLWDWLYAQRTGLMRAEGEGYYDGDGPYVTWA